MINKSKNQFYKHDLAHNSGMALVTVIIFSAVGIIVIVAALALTSITSQSNLYFLQGQRALIIAEAGAENALIRLLRDPEYRHEVLTIGNGTARIDVSSDSSTKVVRVEGRVGLASRRIEIVTVDTNGITTVDSWKEVFDD